MTYVHLPIRVVKLTKNQLKTKHKNEHEFNEHRKSLLSEMRKRKEAGI